MLRVDIVFWLVLILGRAISRQFMVADFDIIRIAEGIVEMLLRPGHLSRYVACGSL